MLNLKDTIISKFGSVNKFCQTIDETVLSKQTIYKLLKNVKPNPTIMTVVALSYYLEVDILELIETFKTMNQEVKL
jgi:DNA-binding phage protein